MNRLVCFIFHTFMRTPRYQLFLEGYEARMDVSNTTETLFRQFYKWEESSNLHDLKHFYSPLFKAPERGHIHFLTFYYKLNLSMLPPSNDFNCVFICSENVKSFEIQAWQAVESWCVLENIQNTIKRSTYDIEITSNLHWNSDCHYVRLYFRGLWVRSKMDGLKIMKKKILSTFRDLRNLLKYFNM